MIDIICKNDGRTLTVPEGSTLEEVYLLATGARQVPAHRRPVVARVNNKVEGLHCKLYTDKMVEFLDITTPSGQRCYTRSVFFVLCKAAHELFDPHCKVTIDIPVSNGYYVDLDLQRPVTLDDVRLLRGRMQEMIDCCLPIHRFVATTDDAIKMWSDSTGETRQGQGQDTEGSCGRQQNSKVKLLRSTGALYTTYYDLEGYRDYFYGAMLTNTSQIYLFGLEKYYDGLLLRLPSAECPSELGEMVMQDKMFAIFKEHHHWQDLLGLRTIGDLNEVICQGRANLLIQVSEALQEKKIARMADDITMRMAPSPRTPHAPALRMVLIAGPSSSGKTTTCKRLSVQLLTNGVKPVPISLDDYFVNREDTPKDENGDYDYEHIHALNLEMLNEHLATLFKGGEVELPRYDFQTGRSVKSGKRLRLRDDEVLIVEGIHALNPELTAQIPEAMKYRVYASALTTILLDSHNYVPTTDNRLLRRIIRDHKYRGVTAQETIRRWPSVRKGEARWIFPFQERADQMFNTAMIFELAVIKRQAVPLLEQVPENCPEYAEAYRLRKFLGYIHPIAEDQIPPTSLLREFLGGSSFDY